MSADDAKPIRALREERGWTAADLAHAAGVPAEQVELWEAGDPNADPARFADIAGRGFGLPWAAIRLPDGWGHYEAGGRRFLVSVRQAGDRWVADLRAHERQDPTVPALPRLNEPLHAEGDTADAAYDALRIKIDTLMAGANVTD